jgi:phage host-nuclease inhibitor protein Gam
MGTTQGRLSALLLALAVGMAGACAEAGQNESELAGDGGQPEQAGEPGARALASMTDAFLSEARQATDELQQKVDELRLAYADAMGGAADRWDATQREIMTTHRRLEADMERATQATTDTYDAIRADITDGVETLTEQVEHARLAAVADAQAFVAVSEQQLGELDLSIASLEAEAAVLAQEAQAEVRGELDAMREEAEQIAVTLDDMADASADEIAETREEVTQAIASLAGSVQRTWLELRSESTVSQ